MRYNFFNAIGFAEVPYFCNHSICLLWSWCDCYSLHVLHCYRDLRRVWRCQNGYNRQVNPLHFATCMSPLTQWYGSPNLLHKKTQNPINPKPQQLRNNRALAKWTVPKDLVSMEYSECITIKNLISSTYFDHQWQVYYIRQWQLHLNHSSRQKSEATISFRKILVGF